MELLPCAVSSECCSYVSATRAGQAGRRGEEKEIHQNKSVSVLDAAVRVCQRGLVCGGVCARGGSRGEGR